MSHQSPEEKILACPHCGASLRIRPEDRGARRACSQCGQAVGVPNASRPSPQASPDASIENVAKRHADIPVVCRLCGTRIYAFSSQIGEMVSCPDCTTPNEVKTPVAKPSRRWASISIHDGDDLKIRGDVDQPSPEEIQTFYIRCPRCQAQMAARHDHVGQQMTCSDCGLQVEIPQPPKVKPAKMIDTDFPDLAIDPPEHHDAIKKNAETLLARAEQEHIERKEERQHEPSYGTVTRPKRPFDEGVFTFPFRLSILPLTVTLGTLACASTVLAHGGFTSEGVDMLLGLLMLVGAGLIAAVLMLLASASCLSIMEQTSNSVDETTAMPPYELLAWLWSGFFIVSSGVVSLFPGFLLNFIVDYAFIGLGVPALFFTFPFFLLSMLEANSPGVPYSPDIWRSLQLASSAWRKFYSRATILLVIIASLVAVIWYTSGAPFAWLLTAVATTTCGIIYFRLLGRLALVISDVLTEAEVDETNDPNVEAEAERTVNTSDPVAST